MFLSSSQTPPNPPLTNLYIAQAPLSHLPSPLRSDLPTPLLVSHAGRGDIYSSSIWLGLQPTYTPWHRDPNPNLFCQLCGTKVLRLMAPKRGEALFRGVMASLAVAAGSGKIRGEEMMKGEQRRALERAVWAGDGEGADDMMYEVTVQAGDMLFMPLGWWHSVKSAGEEGGINGSVNWWFR
ncbi:Clavaminate synthase-like protein [Neurospora tetrasperma FGSC 2509]|nr:Clavaminate synthase-like protein [Neurospora tetrasperma FGSC 2509]